LNAKTLQFLIYQYNCIGIVLIYLLKITPCESIKQRYKEVK